MEFVWVCIGMLVVLGIIAGIANHFDKGNDEVQTGHDCANCSEAIEGSCKIHCLLEEKQRNNKSD